MWREERDAYRDACGAARDAIERAVTSPSRLKPRDWRVLLAVLHVTALYSRVEDETTVGQLAQLANLSRQRTSESLARLDAAGVIAWTPTRTRGKTGASRVTLERRPPSDPDLDGVW